MKWYYKILGGHTHVRVFMNGGKCGDLVFRNEEFHEIRSCDGIHNHFIRGSRQNVVNLIEFLNETPQEENPTSKIA